MRPLLATLSLAALALIAALPSLPQTAVAGHGDADAAVQENQPPAVAARPRVEVVFALDTTGSMGGLIDGAKAKIWSIARALLAGDPRPDVAIGLVAYRDLGDLYVTRITPLSTDLDLVYGDLMALGAEGGGDGPEHVNRALAVATHDIAWSEGKGVTRIVFLVGDAPPHDDYPQDVAWTTSVEQAVRKGIVVNTVRCGSDALTEQVFGRIARRGEGRYVSLAQDGGVQVVATPFDDEIGALRRRLGSTYLTYGGSAEREARRAYAAKSEARAAMAPAPAAAERAAYLAESGATLGDKDLVEDAAAGRIDLSRIEPQQLPEEMRAMKPAERAARVAAIDAERKGIGRDIERLSAQRDAFLASRAAAGAGGDSFDAEVLEIVREQAGRNGVSYAPRSAGR